MEVAVHRPVSEDSEVRQVSPQLVLVQPFAGCINWLVV